MRDTGPLLQKTSFPALRRAQLETLQLNLGYRCNLSCIHCHVGAGPRRTERMARPVMDLALEFIDRRGITTLDVTGGSPEMHPDFRYLMAAAAERGIRVMDRCNPTIIEEAGYGWVPEFLAEHRIEVVASLPCYSSDNVDAQRGKGVFDASIRGLQKLNALGYGRPDSALVLNLVYNPLGASLPPPQEGLRADYQRFLGERFGIVFNELFTIANMPIQRFGSLLLSRGQFDDYMGLLHTAHRPENTRSVMCRSLISVDYQGYVHDCDFNQMLGLSLGANGASRTHLRDLLDRNLAGTPIAVADHCYGCTAGQGSSCGGALN